MGDEEVEPKPYAPTIEEPPVVSSRHAGAFLRQALGASLAFWVVTAIGAAIATLRWTEGFVHYLKFSAMIVFGLVLFGGSTLANRITTMGADKWGLGHGRYGYEEDYGTGGGLTAMGIVFVLVPQIGLVAYLID